MAPHNKPLHHEKKNDGRKKTHLKLLGSRTRRRYAGASAPASDEVRTVLVTDSARNDEDATDPGDGNTPSPLIRRPPTTPIGIPSATGSVSEAGATASTFSSETVLRRRPPLRPRAASSAAAATPVCSKRRCDCGGDDGSFGVPGIPPAEAASTTTSSPPVRGLPLPAKMKTKDK